MAKALFGSVVSPAELRVLEENAALRAKVRRLEQELEDLRAQRDALVRRLAALQDALNRGEGDEDGPVHDPAPQRGREPLRARRPGVSPA